MFQTRLLNSCLSLTLSLLLTSPAWAQASQPAQHADPSGKTIPNTLKNVRKGDWIRWELHDKRKQAGKSMDQKLTEIWTVERSEGGMILVRRQRNERTLYLVLEAKKELPSWLLVEFMEGRLKRHTENPRLVPEQMYGDPDATRHRLFGKSQFQRQDSSILFSRSVNSTTKGRQDTGKMTATLNIDIPIFGVQSLDYEGRRHGGYGGPALITRSWKASKWGRASKEQLSPIFVDQGVARKGILKDQPFAHLKPKNSALFLVQNNLALGKEGGQKSYQGLYKITVQKNDGVRSLNFQVQQSQGKHKLESAFRALPRLRGLSQRPHLYITELLPGVYGPPQSFKLKKIRQKKSKCKIDGKSHPALKCSFSYQGQGSNKAVYELVFSKASPVGLVSFKAQVHYQFRAKDGTETHSQTLLYKLKN